jgi:uncharacterized protein YjiS (DUF1127 family)
MKVPAIHTSASSSSCGGFGVADFCARLAAWVAAICDRARQREELARLDDRALKDLGLTRCDVEAELCKPVWKP